MSDISVTGVRQGTFDILQFLRAGTLQDINTVLDGIGGGSGSGGLVTSAVAPLSIDGAGALSISLTAYATTVALNNALAGYTSTTGLNTLLAGYLQTSHQAANIGSADVIHGGFDIETRTLTLKNAAAVTKALSIDNGGNLVWAADGLVTVPMLATQEHTSLSFRDSASVVRNMIPSANGSITYAGSQLASISDLAGYQQSITAGTGISLVGSTLSTYALKWDTSNSPTVMPQCLIFNDFGISQNLNIGTSQYEFIVTAPVSAAALAAKQDALVGVTQSGTSQILLAPTHMPTMSGSGGWVDQGTYATVGLLSTVNGWNHYASLATYTVGQTYTLSCDVRLISGSTSMFHFGFIYFNGSIYTGTGATFDASHGLNTTTFTTVSVSFTAPVTSMYHVFGCAPGISHGQSQAGNVHIKSVTITAPAVPAIDFSNNVTMQSTLVVGSTISCTSLTQTSDESVKSGIADISPQTANAILAGCNARTFCRTDLGEDEALNIRRAGFVAQELRSCIPSEWNNIVTERDGLLGVSYDRLTAILWTCLQDTNRRLAALEAAQ